MDSASRQSGTFPLKRGPMIASCARLLGVLFTLKAGSFSVNSSGELNTGKHAALEFPMTAAAVEAYFIHNFVFTISPRNMKILSFVQLFFFYFFHLKCKNCAPFLMMSFGASPSSFSLFFHSFLELFSPTLHSHLRSGKVLLSFMDRHLSPLLAELLRTFTFIGNSSNDISIYRSPRALASRTRCCNNSIFFTLNK